ncbi:hypothetical protein NAT51_10990 [Flavobacterium amniphilum]|uniref:hypothetical protein n=1 Tax=Flavobacterium amniphilum TaxID=1834035 RepID=UPI00202AA6D0|nr:hypothetical protein [Flavobacterium amniphilum]MCL9806053.1 hypothetical protein [Flavobacterium amniphilum]
MSKNEDKHIEELVDHFMKDRVLDTPSFDFTSKVMSQVLTTKTSSITKYEPLISKKILITIFSLLLALIISSFFYDTTGSSRWAPHIDFIPFNNITASYEFSAVTTYSFVLTAIMIFIQIPILKNYYDSKFDV